MGIVFRQSIKGSIVIFGGILLGAVFTYVSSRVLPKGELGGVRNLLSQGAVVQLILLAGAANLVNPYLLRYADDDPRRPVLITITLALPLIIAVATSIPYFLLKDLVVSRYQYKDRAFVSSYYAWLPLLSLLLAYLTLLEYYLTAQLKVAAAVFMREVVLRAFFLGLIALYALHLLSLHWFIIGTVLIHVVPVSLLLLLSLRTKGFRIAAQWNIFTRKEYREIAHYAWFHLLTGATLNLIGYVDALMLGPLSKAGLDDVAVYVNAQFLISIMYAPYRAMGSAAFPKLAEAFLAKAGAELHDLFNRSGLNMLIVAVAMWLIVVCNLHNAVAILPRGYGAIAPIVLILSIGRMVEMGTGLNTELISVTQYYKFNFRLALFLLLAVIVCDRIFIPRYGIFGVAWVSSLTAVAANLVKTAFLYRKTGLHPFSRHSLGILLAGVAAFGSNWIVPRLSNPIGDAVLRSLVLISVYTAMLIVLRPSPDLSKYLRQMRKDKRLF